MIFEKCDSLNIISLQPAHKSVNKPTNHQHININNINMRWFILFLAIVFSVQAAIESTSPCIAVTAVPRYGQFGSISFRVHASGYRLNTLIVAIYIEVSGRWWVKPTADKRWSSLDSTGADSTYFTNGGKDEYATAFKLAVIHTNNTATIPLALGSWICPTVPGTLAETYFTRDSTIVWTQSPDDHACLTQVNASAGVRRT